MKMAGANVNPAPNTQWRTLLPAEQINKRVRETGRQICDDYLARTIHVLALLENAFMFTADLVRALKGPVICQFIKPQYRHGEFLEMFSAMDPISVDSTCCWSKDWCTQE